jgi:hypothetical protein
MTIPDGESVPETAIRRRQWPTRLRRAPWGGAGRGPRLVRIRDDRRLASAGDELAAAEAAAVDYRRPARAESTTRSYRVAVARFTRLVRDALAERAAPGCRRPSPHFSARRRAGASPSVPCGHAKWHSAISTSSPAHRFVSHSLRDKAEFGHRDRLPATSPPGQPVTFNNAVFFDRTRLTPFTRFSWQFLAHFLAHEVETGP